MIFDFIGWCKEGVHDKVWGVIDLGDALKGQRLTFWGRRGKKLSTKLAFYDRALVKLIDNKQYKKAYVKIDPAQLDQVYPEFKDDLERTAIWATLKF